MTHLPSIWYGENKYSRPKVRSYSGSNPAANAEISETVPTGKLWELLSITVSNVQGGGGTALTALVLTDGTNTIGRFPGSSSAQNAGVTAQYNWGIGLALGAGAAATTILAPIPAGLLLPAGFKITTTTTDAGGAKDFGIPQILVVEYSVNAT